ncbi:unnamed protein product [Prunus armeniaca]|uniref:Uncharacterized protein n=1 Tax=Prunus armeniaca TaxID=36596 RepID=A0A6J5VX90_PRUAR|nr:unnamed protein product [Prunus armeniaca]
MNPLLHVLKKVKLLKQPMLEGMVPLSALKEMSRDSSLLRAFSTLGMLPVRKLLDNEILVSFFRLAMESGIGPQKWFLFRLIMVSSVRETAQDSQNWPDVLRTDPWQIPPRYQDRNLGGWSWDQPNI